MTTQTRIAGDAAWAYTLLAAAIMVTVAVAVVWFYA